MGDIILQDITKSYDGFIAINHLNLECKAGEFLAILGPSGAGKTTILKMIAGIEKPTGGQVMLHGVPVNDVPPQDRDVAMVFENYALFPHLTVRENIEFPLKAPRRVKERTPKEINQQVEEMAQMVGLGKLLDRRVNQLSGGQRQRVSLARALVRKPPVILMDEPLAHLDVKLRDEMRGQLKRIHKELGSTIIYVTHEYIEAMAMATKIAVINKGELQQVGTPNEIYFHPKNEFVASTVGDPPMNFITADLIHREGTYYASFEQNRLALGNLRLPVGGMVDIGIKPKDIMISDVRIDEDDISGIIQIIEPLGPYQIMKIEVGKRIITVKCQRDPSLKRGNLIFLKFDISKLYFFDYYTKQLISVS